MIDPVAAPPPPAQRTRGWRPGGTVTTERGPGPLYLPLRTVTLLRSLWVFKEPRAPV